jgi:hypothetical protein
MKEIVEVLLPLVKNLTSKDFFGVQTDFLPFRNKLFLLKITHPKSFEIVQ